MIKYLLLSLLVIQITTNALTAQKMVSTDPQLRNVVIEEFTGIHCGNCPKGHKISHELVNQYPGDVFSVNIHAGGFATPSTGEPDFRTDEGDAILIKSEAAFFPSASINRTTSPWALTIDSIKGITSRIMQEISPVNVAVKSIVDAKTRILTTEVEYYYTSESPKSVNYLTVFLIQNNILGPQSDYGDYYPENWEDGLYKHNHVLRMALTTGDLFRDPINTTTKGAFEKRTYEVTLPESIKGVNLRLYDCEVIAFVSEDTGNIYSAAGTEVEFTDPLEEISTDLELSNKTEFPTRYCFTSIHPIVDVTNNSDKVVKSFDLKVTLDGQDYVQTFEGSLDKDQTTTIDWGEIEFMAEGTYTIKIEGFSNINDNELIDVNDANNMVEHTGVGVKVNGFL